MTTDTRVEVRARGNQYQREWACYDDATIVATIGGYPSRTFGERFEVRSADGAFTGDYGTFERAVTAVEDRVRNEHDAKGEQ